MEKFGKKIRKHLARFFHLYVADEKGLSTVYRSPCPSAIKNWQTDHKLVCINWMMKFFLVGLTCPRISLAKYLFCLRVTAKVNFLCLCNNSSHFLFDLELFFCINVTLLVFVQSGTLLFV